MPSLRRTDATWLSTVRTEMNRLPDLLMRELLAEQPQHLTLAGTQRTQVRRHRQVSGPSLPVRAGARLGLRR
jgi:hypothetical protein